MAQLTITVDTSDPADIEVGRRVLDSLGRQAGGSDPSMPDTTGSGADPDMQDTMGLAADPDMPDTTGTGGGLGGDPDMRDTTA